MIIKVVFTIILAFLAFFMVASNDKDERKTLAIAFVSTIASIVALYVLDFMVALWY